MRAFGVLAASMLLLVGCAGQQGSTPEKSGKKGAEEKTVTTRQTVEKTVEETTGLAPGYTAEEQAKADAAKAAAAEEDITLEQLGSIDASTSYGEQLVLGLGSCQLIKFRTAVGKKAYNEWQDEFVDEVAETTGPVTSIQEEMIMMGYSCSVPEAMAGMPAEE